MPYTVSLRDDNYIDWARSICTTWIVAQNINSRSNWQRMRDRLDGIRLGMIYCTDLMHSPESDKTFGFICDDIALLMEITYEYETRAKTE